MTTLENRPNTALLVVDVQNGVVEGTPERDSVVANVGSLVEKARQEQVPVVWVQHFDDGLERGSDEWKIVPELAPDEAEPLIEKSYGDSFEDTTLETVLSGLGVGRLVVVGAQTDACIRSTLHGAFARGYDATLVSDAHTTEDQTAWGRRRRNRSSRTRTCTGPIKRRRGARPGRSRPRMSTSTACPEACAVGGMPIKLSSRPSLRIGLAAP
jgi:nicotinamidase-related amidase